MKKFLSLLMMTLLTATAWAGTVTFDLTAQGYANAADVTSVTSSDVTLTFAKATGSNAPKYYTSGSAVRMYNSNTLTIEAPGDITALVFTCVSGYDCTGTFNSGSYKSPNWTSGEITSTSVVYTCGSSQTRIQKIEVTYEEATQSNVATPSITLSPAEGPYYEGTTVTATIACETTGATCYYSTDGENWIEGTTVALTTTTTLSAKAVLDNDESNVATKTVTFVPAPTNVATIAEYKNLGIGDEFTFTGNVTVTYVNGNNLYVKDATGAALIFGYNLPTFTAGQVLNAGWTGKTKDYNGLLEVDQAANLSASNETVEVTPTEYAVSAITTANDNEYIIVKNVTLGEVSNRNFTITDAENNTVTGRTNFNGVTHPTDLTKNYDVTCCVGEYNGTVQLYPTEYVAVQEPAEEVTLTITPDATGNVYDAPVEVSIACSDPDAIVTYKLGENGAEQDYTEPFTIYESTTVYAYAVSENAADIIEASMAYTINLAPIAVTFTPAAGTYEGTQNVKVAIANTYGDVVATYYLNNEEVQYNDETGIEVAQSATIKVEVMDDYHADVAEFTAEYVITEPQPVDPTLTTATIVFDNYETDSNTAITSDELMEYITEGANYVASAADINKVYKGKTGLKFSSSSANGAMTLNFAEAFTNVTKVEVEAMAWLNTSGAQADATAAINGQAVNTELATYEIMGETESLESLTLSATKRVYVKSITITYKNEETPEPAKNVIAYTVPENCEMTVATADGAPIVSGETEVEEGTQVVITVTPAEGYQVKSVTVTKDEVNVTPSDDPYGGEFGAPRRADSLDDAFVEVTAGENGAYTFVMPNVPVTIDVAVEEESPVTAISDINAANAGTVKYVNAQGQVSNRPFQGVNIVIDGNKTYKIVK